MKASILSFFFILLFSVFLLRASFGHSAAADDFVKCLSISNITYTPNNPSYYPILNFSMVNLRFASPGTPKPQVIVTPFIESHIQGTIICAKKTGLEIRIRCGGHDFEGQSYMADVPFIILDLFNMHEIKMDAQTAVVWAQAGATLGEIHYKIAKTSRILAFPGSEFPSVGIGGFISGGGYGMLQRKYGIAADHVIDARIIDANGQILDRKSMGEDLFWAIRGGGGGNFAVVVAWKIKLVPVPANVTIFDVAKVFEPKTLNLIHKWQSVAPYFPADLYVRIITTNNAAKSTAPKTNSVPLFQFQSMFLGNVDELLQLINSRLPELGLERKDCKELSWIEAILHFGPVQKIQDLLGRDYLGKVPFKVKSDYVTKPISLEGLEGLYKLVSQREPGSIFIEWSPYGGKMSEIPDIAIPFPHRAGNLFVAFFDVFLNGTVAAAAGSLNWSRKLYKYLTPFVSKNPRRNYVNYRDLDFGITSKNTTAEEAKIWGARYFNHNYDRLVRVKTKVDPHNFFRTEQSIPPLFPAS